MKTKIKPVNLKKHIENVRNAILTIKDSDRLSPSDILKMNLVVSRNLVPSYWTLYRMINSGKIKSYNISAGDSPAYLIDGKSLKDYLRGAYKL